MIDRRRLFLTAAATAAVAPSLVQAKATQTEADGRLNSLLDGWFEADIDESPERATNLGLDRGARAPIQAQVGGALRAFVDIGLEPAVQQAVQPSVRFGLSGLGLNQGRRDRRRGGGGQKKSTTINHAANSRCCLLYTSPSPRD